MKNKEQRLNEVMQSIDRKLMSDKKIREAFERSDLDKLPAVEQNMVTMYSEMKEYIKKRGW